MRRFVIGLLASSLLTLVTGAQASGLGARMERAVAAPSAVSASRTRRISGERTASVVRNMLVDGAALAVMELGTPGGFDRHTGSSHRAASDEDRAGMTPARIRLAAENTASQAGPVLREAINALHVRHPRSLLDGGSMTATEFLRDNAGERLRAALRPIVAGALADSVSDHALSASGTRADPDSRLAHHIAYAAVDALLDVMGRHEAVVRQLRSGSPLMAGVTGRAI